MYKNSSDKLFKNKDKFSDYLIDIIPELKEKENKTLLKGLIQVLSEYDETADTYKDKKEKYEADPELKYTETIPYKEKVDEYFSKEVAPYLSNAWYEYDDENPNISCEINFNRFFYKYCEPESSTVILERLQKLDSIEKNIEDILYGRK